MAEEPTHTPFCQLWCRAAASEEQKAEELQCKAVQQGSPKGPVENPWLLLYQRCTSLTKKNPESVRLNQVESLMLMQDLTLPDTILSCTGSH